MNEQQLHKQQSTFIFTIEVMVEDKDNAAAIEKLMRKLNTCKFQDYRILSGIRLGELIDESKASADVIHNIPVEQPRSAAPDQNPANASELLAVYQNIRNYMKQNTLIRLLVNKGLGITLNIPCRIINFDEQDQLLTVYHVDEKRVYTFRLNEIEDFNE